MYLTRLFSCFQFRLEDDVNKLDYSNNIFTDGFPQVWQYERTLEELHVTSTRISYLPLQLFYCQGLKVLFANNNNLENIPEAVGSLRQLQQLNISRNFISSVPDNIKSCKNLTHLDLSCNSLQKLPNSITCLISLQELILNETYLEFLPANFGRLVNLRIVELRTNYLVSLPKSMQRLTNLQRLDIGCNEFTEMPEVIGELKQLRELWFDFNQIQTLPLQLGKLRELEHFEANGNCLRNLRSEIGSWHKVEVLSLSSNNLTTFPLSVGMLKSLVTLKCESNELQELPGCISNLENLEELVLSHNNLSYLPNTLGMLRKLRYLFADYNNLQKLPDEICSCSVLSVVSVSHNELLALPDNLGHLKNLRVLNIVQNNIATLPVSLLRLVNLSSLWISNNQSKPLIPLQYTEVSKETHLTCFMLPQLGYRLDSVSENNSNKGEEIAKAQQFENKGAECYNNKRRICFAEETTILHTDEQTPHLLKPSHIENENFQTLSNNNAEIKASALCEYTETKSENVVLKDCLMRSPTPYPNELRLMAKYVTINQQKSFKSCNRNNYDHHKSNSLLETKSDIFQGECNSIFKKTFFHCVNLESNSLHKERKYIEKGQNEKKISEPVINCEQIVISQYSPKPPPYHIARSFTKKSAKDLTNYEFTRKQQEQQLRFRNRNPYTDNNILEQKNIYTDAKSEVTLNSNCKYECLFGQNKVSNEYTMGSNTIETKFCENHPSNIQKISNNFGITKHHKSRSKWLFGAHINPRVMQINVNWENCQDLEIDILPNKEGIFVTSTVSDTNASQLIHPLDKLLEVDGVDFTNININEAREILQNSKTVISIMLSRK